MNSALSTQDSAPGAQRALELGDAPDSEVMLRDAFVRSGLARQGHKFEDWIAKSPIHKQVLVNINEARLLARAEQQRARP